MPKFTVTDRVLELRRVPARDLIANDKNWRSHGKAQRAALEGVLREVGLANAVLARETPAGLMLIDGHLRADVLDGQVLPVLVLDVDEAEADLLLATLDPIGAMAGASTEALDALLRDVSSAEAGVQELLAGLAERHGVIPPAGDAPADEAPFDEGAIPEDRYQSQYGVIVMCADEAEQERAYEELRDAGYTCRVVTT